MSAMRRPMRPRALVLTGLAACLIALGSAPPVLAQGGPPTDKRREIEKKLDEERREQAEKRRRAEAARRKQAETERRRKANEARRRRDAEERRRKARQAASLRNVRIWVLSKTRSPSRDWCGILRRAGAIVKCSYGFHGSQNRPDPPQIYIQCPRLPLAKAHMVRRLLGVTAFPIRDWRRSKSWGQCGGFNEIAVYTGE